MKEQQHIIEKVTLDIELADTMSRSEIQAEVKSILNTEILAQIENMATHLISEEQVLKIDKMVFNLNNLPIETLKSEFVASFRQQFQSQLEQELEKTKQDNREQKDEQKGSNQEFDLGSKSQLISKKYRSEEVILHFLKTGQYVWWFDSSKMSFNTLFDKTFKNPSNQLSLKLKAILSDFKVVTRAIWQLSSEQYQTIMLLLGDSSRTENNIQVIVQELKDELPPKLREQVRKMIRLSVAASDELEIEKLYQLFWKTLFHLDQTKFTVLIQKMDLESLNTFEASSIPKNKIRLDLLRAKEKFEIVQLMKRTKKVRLSKEQQTANLVKHLIGEINPQSQSDDLQGETTLYVPNAGMVLIVPFLSSFFKALHLLEDHEFRNKEARFKAMAFLEYMKTGQDGLFEPELGLNKLLCGLSIDDPIPSDLFCDKEEKEQIEVLLQEVIEQWPILKNTSSNGLRQSFLQRPGKLIQTNKGWLLKVERSAMDIVVDRIPWGFKTVKLPWMEEMIMVEW